MRRFVLLLVLAFAIASVGPAAAQVCFPGSTGPGGNAPCTPCASGYFAPASGMVACLPCPAGSYSLPGSFACSVCPAGTFASGPGNASCSPCPVGFISATASAACTPCPPGYTSDPSHTFCVEQTTPALPTTWGRLKTTYR